MYYIFPKNTFIFILSLIITVISSSPKQIHSSVENLWGYDTTYGINGIVRILPKKFIFEDNPNQKFNYTATKSNLIQNNHLVLSTGVWNINEIGIEKHEVFHLDDKGKSISINPSTFTTNIAFQKLPLIDVQTISSNTSQLNVYTLWNEQNLVRRESDLQIDQTFSYSTKLLFNDFTNDNRFIVLPSQNLLVFTNTANTFSPTFIYEISNDGQKITNTGQITYILAQKMAINPYSELFLAIACTGDRQETNCRTYPHLMMFDKTGNSAHDIQEVLFSKDWDSLQYTYPYPDGGFLWLTNNQIRHIDKNGYFNHPFNTCSIETCPCTVNRFIYNAIYLEVMSDGKMLFSEWQAASKDHPERLILSKCENNGSYDNTFGNNGVFILDNVNFTLNGINPLMCCFARWYTHTQNDGKIIIVNNNGYGAAIQIMRIAQKLAKYKTLLPLVRGR